jgi:hypothetical protein
MGSEKNGICKVEGEDNQSTFSCFQVVKQGADGAPVQEFITIQNLSYRILVFKVPCDSG